MMKISKFLQTCTIPLSLLLAATNTIASEVVTLDCQHEARVKTLYLELDVDMKNEIAEITYVDADVTDTAPVLVSLSSITIGGRGTKFNSTMTISRETLGYTWVSYNKYSSGEVIEGICKLVERTIQTKF